MPITNQHGGRRGGVLAAAVAAVLAIASGIVLFFGMRGNAGPVEPPLERAGAAATTAPGGAAATTAPGGAAATATSGGPSATRSSPAKAPAAVDFGPVLAASDPVSLDIPAIGVHNDDFVGLGLAKDGTIEVPTDFDQPGWYTPGPTPGQFGPAVIAGHVDGNGGPAIFYRLGELKVGEKVNVTRKDGTVASFAIDKVARYAKADFPTTLVYGTTARAEIRLVTCGGAFDRTTGHYVDNIVVFGHLLA